MTNREWLFEYIKTLSDDELAKLFCQLELDYTSINGTSYYNPFEVNPKYWRFYHNCAAHFIKWLNQEHIDE